MLHFAKWKVGLVLITVIVGILFSLPNLFSEKFLKDTMPSWMPSGQLVLGLDLQGGAHILLQVEEEGVIKERLEVLRGDVRSRLREDKIGYRGLAVKDGAVQVRLRELGDLEAARTKLQTLVQPVTSSILSGGGAMETVLDVNENGLFRLSLTEEGITSRVSNAVAQSIEVIRRRVDELGTTEPSIQREGNNRILVQVPGLQDSDRLKKILESTAKLTFRMVDTSMAPENALQTRPPLDSEVLFEAQDPQNPLPADQRTPYLVNKRVLISGDELDDAQPTFDPQTNEPVVSFRFNTSGATKFARVTEQNVGLPFAIVLDNEVISAPSIREPIRGGSGIISGSFTVDSANDLAVLMRAGALPADLTIIEERTVGPGLGKDSIEAGEVAGLVGACAVVIFMLISYGLFGVFANIALVVNVGMIIGVLSGLGATLTLPGIAGIVLTVGMAVDANVLIYERIREENNFGRSTIAAIDAGYSRALGTILDANITTFIAAIILFSLGSGPVRGFAVTLAVGIVTTVFSAFTFNRLLVATWVKARRPANLPI
ncbi:MULTISPECIES: protein translocase subunit SecD [Cohaesibacter]|uniref:protein translocase subunit SecD n=1 Tax=Cohaesibacter TaxID=655352 RepID=UPI0010FE1783|nr:MULTISPECIES: protein translocase subunit SecD [Cohaesibacter]TLP49089.1 protein translocase subunit SecD [Cohaesibacter sp. CAU 1516]